MTEQSKGITITIPANRVAAIVAFLTGIASAVAGITNALPATWADGAATVVGVLGAIVTCLHFMTGSQRFDALQTSERETDLTTRRSP